MTTTTWTREAVARRVIELLVELFDPDDHELGASVKLATLWRSRSFDSLETVDFMMAFEEAFGFEFDDTDLESCATVADLIEYLCARLGVQ